MEKVFSDRKAFGVLIILVIGFHLSSCTSRSSGNWVHLVSLKESLAASSLGVTSNNGDLWVAGKFSSFAEIIRQNENSVQVEAYYPPWPNKVIVGLCASDKIWILMNDMTLVSYDPIGRSTFFDYRFRELPGNHEWPGCTILDNKLVIWRNNWIAAEADNWAVEILEGTDSKIIQVAQDINKTDWLMAADGTLYRRNKGGWSVVKKLGLSIDAFLATGIFAITMDNVAWIGVDNNLYQWPLNSEVEPKLVLTLPAKESDRFLLVQSVDSESIWIVANSGIWVYKQGIFQTLERPYEIHPDGTRNPMYIQGAFFDKNTSRIYLTAKNGVYYQDLR